MSPKRVAKIAFLALVVAPVFIGVFGLLVMSLWNWLLPWLFGLPKITFWQAWGVLLLSRILFGSFGGNRQPERRWRERLIDRWERMSSEQRERFRAGLRGRCGPFEEPLPEMEV